MSEETSRAIWILEDSPATSSSDDGKESIDMGGIYDQTEKNPPLEKKRTLVKSEVLKKRMAEFLDVMEEVLDQAQRKNTNIQLDEVQLSVEINGEGQISLIGVGGGKAGSKGTISLKFKRKEVQG